VELSRSFPSLPIGDRFPIPSRGSSLFSVVRCLGRCPTGRAVRYSRTYRRTVTGPLSGTEMGGRAFEFHLSANVWIVCANRASPRDRMEKMSVLGNDASNLVDCSSVIVDAFSGTSAGTAASKSTTNSSSTDSEAASAVTSSQSSSGRRFASWDALSSVCGGVAFLVAVAFVYI
jgi:hypothetical protein